MARTALGKGLEALIPSSVATAAVSGQAAVNATATAEAPAAGDGVHRLPIEEIGPNPFQPRTRFDEASLQELASSIQATGVLQPVMVRRRNDTFELVVGERRLRAAKLAGLDTIPAVIRELGDTEMMELALIENVQREDLNPIDEAKAYQALVTKVGLTHDQVSERVGKQRSSVSNSLRLLSLPPEVQDMVSRGTLTAGHGRALLALESGGEQLATARYVHSKAFSVRRTEALINRKLRRATTRPRANRIQPILAEWENKLQQKFATRVSVSSGRKGGKVEFEYYSQDDLERLLEAWGVL